MGLSENRVLMKTLGCNEDVSNEWEILVKNLTSNSVMLLLEITTTTELITHVCTYVIC
jgi:hypothetical protein